LWFFGVCYNGDTQIEEAEILAASISQLDRAFMNYSLVLKQLVTVRQLSRKKERFYQFPFTADGKSIKALEPPFQSGRSVLYRTKQRGISVADGKCRVHASARANDTSEPEEFRDGEL
jgi:hypothetical protein